MGADQEVADARTEEGAILRRMLADADLLCAVPIRSSPDNASSSEVGSPLWSRFWRPPIRCRFPGRERPPRRKGRARDGLGVGHRARGGEQVRRRGRGRRGGRHRRGGGPADGGRPRRPGRIRALRPHVDGRHRSGRRSRDAEIRAARHPAQQRGRTVHRSLRGRRRRHDRTRAAGQSRRRPQDDARRARRPAPERPRQSGRGVRGLHLVAAGPEGQAEFQSLHGRQARGWWGMRSPASCEISRRAGT